MRRNMVLWTLVCALSLLCGILFVGCDWGNSNTIGINFYVGNERVSYRIVAQNETIKFPAVECKEGYYNDGWYFDKGVWQEAYSSSALLNYMQMGVSSVDLYARVIPFSYTITYLNTGTADIGAFPKSFNAESGRIVLPQSVPRPCHIFSGWTMDGVPVTEINPQIAHDITLTANFEVKHEDIRINQGYDATCTEDGLSGGSYCAVCHETISEGTVIPAFGHNYAENWEWQGTDAASVKLVCRNDPSHTHTMRAEISVSREEATCYSEGKTIYTASALFEGQIYRDTKEVLGEKIPHVFVAQSNDKVNHICKLCQQKFPHTDEDFDGVCNDCGLTYEIIHKISNGLQLYEIENDLTATYVLTQDITLSGDWGGIGRKTPFAGKFYGNGKVISGLQFSATSDCALFVNNAGVINGLTLSGMKLSVDNASATIGGIAAHNYGTIKNCTVKGSNQINHTAHWQLQDSNSRTCTFVGGAICGENRGEIVGCSVEGTMSNTFHTECNAYHQGMVPGISPMAKVTDNVFYGNVAGKNSGSICETSVTCANSISLSARATGVYPVDGATATLNCSVGSFVGQNGSLLKDCSARASVVTQDPTTDGKSKSYAYVNLKQAPMFAGVLGEHTGSTEGFTII